MKFKSQLEQQRLQLQREHSSEMEQILEKVSQELKLFFSFLPPCATIGCDRQLARFSFDSQIRDGIHSHTLSPFENALRKVLSNHYPLTLVDCR